MGMKEQTRTGNIWKVISVILFLFLLGLGALFFSTNRTKQSADNTDPYVKEISKLMVLPKEIPMVTNIDDVAKFQERYPLLLKSAKAGDVLLGFRYWTILYDPKIKKILNIASVFHLDVPPPLTPLRISLRYNGKEDEKVKAFKLQLEKVSLNYQVVEMVPSGVEYSEDVVYLVNPTREEDVIFLARALGNSPVLKTPDTKETFLASVDVIIAFRNTGL